MPIFTIITSLIVFATLATLIVAFILKRKVFTVNKVNNTRRIVYIAIFSALMAVLNVVGIDTGINKISFTLFGACLMGIMFGGTDAFIICFCGDFITGVFLYPSNYMPMLSISSGLFGFIFGSIFSIKSLNRYVKIVAGYIISFAVCTVFINTFALYYRVTFSIANFSLSSVVRAEAFMPYLFSRVLLQLPVSVINLVISLALLEISVKLKNMLYSRLVINFTHAEVEEDTLTLSLDDEQLKVSEDITEE